MKDLLLLHGALGSKNQFVTITKSLSENYNIHSINLSGHGGLAVDGINYSIDLFCNDVILWMQKSGLKEIDIFGYSMGGYVAIALASRRPELVKSIFTLATKFDWSPEIALKEIQMLNPDKIADKVPAYADELKQRHAPADWRAVMQKTAEMMINLGNNPLIEEDFRKVNCPVRISVGDRDKMVSVESSYKTSQLFSKGSFLVLPNTSHPFEMVDIRRLTYEIGSFFTS